MTEKQCRTCSNLTFSRDWYLHANCESCETYSPNDEEQPSDSFTVDDSLDGEHCPFWQEWKEAE